MTCIVGLKTKSGVWFGGDSSAVEPSANFIDESIEQKVFKLDNYLFGYQSSFRIGQVIKYYFKPPKMVPNMDPTKFVVTKFIPKLKSCIEKNSDDEEKDWAILLGFKGHIYEIDCSYYALEFKEDFCSIGAGRDYALSSLYTSRDLEDPVDRIVRSLSCATKYCTHVTGPYHIISTEKDGVDTYEDW